MYRFRRYCSALGSTDPDANAGGAGFGLPPSGSNSGTIGQGAMYLMRIYRYHVDVSVDYAASGGTLLSPVLCWVTSAGAFVDAIEQDCTVVTSVAGSFESFSFDHDYGSDGLIVTRPQGTSVTDLTNYYIGLITRSTAPVVAHCSLAIDYGIDIDYRKFSNVPISP